MDQCERARIQACGPTAPRGLALGGTYCPRGSFNRSLSLSLSFSLSLFLSLSFSSCVLRVPLNDLSKKLMQRLHIVRSRDSERITGYRPARANAEDSDHHWS
jgi:hypothetical protein